MLENFRFAKYSFTMVAKDREEKSLPAYKGFMLRGGMGGIFRRICCPKKHADCDNCDQRSDCIYAYVFETSPPPDAEKLSNYKDIQRPYVVEPPDIEPPDKIKHYYAPGEELNFDLVLIGKALDLNALLYFVLSYGELAKTGLGKDRCKFDLQQVQIKKNEVEHTIFSKDEGFKSQNIVLTYDGVLKETEDLNSSRLAFHFGTPTRVKFRGELVRKPEFHHLIRNLLRRISTLSYFHCDEELEVNYKKLIAQAEKVKCINENLYWKDLIKHSSRKQRKFRIGGFMGSISYEGNLESFLPFLALGRYVHIGKSTVWGYGKYELE